MLDGHEEARKPFAATQIRGEDDAWDRVVCSWVGRWDGPQKVAVLQTP